MKKISNEYRSKYVLMTYYVKYLKEVRKLITYLDLFAGAGGLSEGFASVGYQPIAHVEMDVNACNTLKTRECYYYLQTIL